MWGYFTPAGYESGPRTIRPWKAAGLTIPAARLNLLFDLHPPKLPFTPPGQEGPSRNILLFACNKWNRSCSLLSLHPPSAVKSPGPVPPQPLRAVAVWRGEHTAPQPLPAAPVFICMHRASCFVIMYMILIRCRGFSIRDL